MCNCKVQRCVRSKENARSVKVSDSLLARRKAEAERTRKEYEARPNPYTFALMASADVRARGRVDRRG